MLQILLERLEFDAADGAFCLGLYGDSAAKPALEKMLAEIPEEFSNSADAAKALLEEARVASVPGTAFFESEVGNRMLRFCYAKDPDALEEACRRIRAFRAVRA